MRDLVKKILSRLPSGFTDGAKLAYDCIPPSIRYGKPYRDALALFKESDNWTLEQLEALQVKKLRRLLLHCQENVPYYQRTFAEIGFDAREFSSLQDMQKLPVLTKSDILNNKKDFIARNAHELKPREASTGGSTGNPLVFSHDIHSHAWERALVVRQMNWLGRRPHEVIASLKADSFATGPRLHRYYPCSKQLRFVFRSVTNEDLETIFHTIERRNPRYLKAYPSRLSLLGGWMDRNNKRLPNLKHVVSSSENLYPALREKLNSIFNTKIVDHYGQNEQVATAFECEHASGYHIQMEQSYVELFPANDDKYEIVGTSLESFAMPFIRYRTSDLVSKVEKGCACGRNHPRISAVTGRREDVIITPERRYLTSFVLGDSFNNLMELKSTQLIQEDLHTLRILIEPWEPISCEGAKKVISQALNEHLKGSEIRVFIEVVHEIPRTSRGKLPFIVSRLKLEDYL